MSLTAFEIDDLYRLGWVEEPAISPDGAWVAYVRVSVDRLANRYRRAIWLASTNGVQQRKLTAGAKADTSPRWSPDGTQIAFVSNRDEKPQVYLIDVAGGEARVLTSHAQGAFAPAWSRDGRRIAFLASTTPAERAREDEPAPSAPADELEGRQQRERTAHDDEQRFDPRVITRMPYRSGTTYDDGRQTHLYLIDVPIDHLAESTPARRITDGELGFGPPAWAYDGTALYAALGRDIDADTLFGFNDIVRIDIPATGIATPVRLTAPGYTYGEPQVSPNGAWVAARCNDEQHPLARATTIILIATTGGEVHNLTASADLDLDQFCWSPTSDALYFTAGSWGEQPVYRVPVTAEQSGVQTAFAAEKRYIGELTVGPQGRIAFIAGSPANPCDLFVRNPDGSERRLTNLGDWIAAERDIAPFEELRYRSTDGQIVQGWVLYPPDFAPEHPAPLAVHIHGGPHLMWAPGYRGMWHEYQVNAARGYITFFCNPRGSDGYGETWRDGVHGDWACAGNDILAGIDLLIARGHVDTAKIAITGGSYGGYMTAWLLSHDSRFACGVAARGVYDLNSFYGTSDAHELIEFEFDGKPWEQRELLWHQSPLSHAHQITAPLLLLHAELDWRVPIAQAEQLFNNLRRRKIPTELVRYPREGHELTRSGEPKHRADHMRRTLEWFDRYCGSLKPKADK
jgi:dipeptidyl aminopeptidase/acylaminoacyl peptidase